jgi:hypothetical protein
MFKKILSWIKPETKVIRPEALEKISNSLFPKPVETKEGKSVVITDYSIDSNLYYILLELESGRNDKVVHDALKQCLQKLFEARDILSANYAISQNASRLVVEPPKTENVLETIRVGD